MQEIFLMAGQYRKRKMLRERRIEPRVMPALCQLKRKTFKSYQSQIVPLSVAVTR